MPTLEDQQNLEYEMVQEGVRRYTHQNRKMIDKEIESRTQHGRMMVASVVGEVAKGIRTLQETTTSNRDIARKKVKEMDSDKLAYLALVTVIDGISKRYTLMKVARAIGMFIEDQYRLQLWLAGEGKAAENVLRLANDKGESSYRNKRYGLTNKMNKDGYQYTEWTNEERIHVGLRMIDIIIQQTGIVQLKKTFTGRNKTTTFVVATEATLEWIRRYNEAGMKRRPRYCPCIIPPRDWDDLWGGGYHSDVINKLPFVRAH